MSNKKRMYHKMDQLTVVGEKHEIVRSLLQTKYRVNLKHPASADIVLSEMEAVFRALIALDVYGANEVVKAFATAADQALHDISSNIKNEALEYARLVRLDEEKEEAK